MKRVLLFAFLAGILAANTGCGLFQAVFCGQPCGGCGTCGRCVDACDDGCGPVDATPCRPVRAHRVVADCDEGCETPCAKPCGRAACRPCSRCVESPCDPCADPCGSAGYCARPWYRGPLSCVFALFTPPSWYGGNCGKRYWGDFYSDPPACWDPCDGCGNYAGHGGCRTCGGGHAARYRGGYVDDGEPIADEVEPAPRTQQNVPAPQPTPTSRPRPPKPDPQ